MGDRGLGEEIAQESLAALVTAWQVATRAQPDLAQGRRGTIPTKARHFCTWRAAFSARAPPHHV